MKTVRGLPPDLKAISIRIAADLDSNEPEAKARIAALRDHFLSTEAIFYLEHAACGMGPREMQRRWGGRHEKYSTEIYFNLEKAADFYAKMDAENSP